MKLFLLLVLIPFLSFSNEIEHRSSSLNLKNCVHKSFEGSSLAADFCSLQYLNQINQGITDCLMTDRGQCHVLHQKTTFLEWEELFYRSHRLSRKEIKKCLRRGL